MKSVILRHRSTLLNPDAPLGFRGTGRSASSLFPEIGISGVLVEPFRRLSGAKTANRGDPSPIDASAPGIARSRRGEAIQPVGAPNGVGRQFDSCGAPSPDGAHTGDTYTTWSLGRRRAAALPPRSAPPPPGSLALGEERRSRLSARRTASVENSTPAARPAPPPPAQGTPVLPGS